MSRESGIVQKAKIIDAPAKEKERPTLTLYNEEGHERTKNLDRQGRTKAKVVDDQQLGELRTRKCENLLQEREGIREIVMRTKQIKKSDVCRRQHSVTYLSHTDKEDPP